MCSSDLEGLNTGGVGGVQIADVTVDVETGLVKMNRLIAVQDCGTIINPKTAESQVYGACIMSICGALMEERVMDAITGRMLNNDLEFYKLAGIKDIGEILVHLEIDEINDRRGVIGLGEPPVVGGIAAISLLVGGIGIMNIMLVSVTERTREIGLRKALGAKRAHIVQQFLLEAVILSLIGGAAGIACGAAGAWGVSRLAGWPMALSPGTVLLACLFAAAVGAFFGLFPALRAANQDPIRALRYE